MITADQFEFNKEAKTFTAKVSDLEFERGPANFDMILGGSGRITFACASIMRREDTRQVMCWYYNQVGGEHKALIKNE